MRGLRARQDLADPVGATACLHCLAARDYPRLREGLAEAARTGEARPLASVALHAPALSPSKIIACACNYADHVAEMHDVATDSETVLHDDPRH